MYQEFRPNRFNILPPVVKNLLIINGLFFLVTQLFISKFNFSLFNILGMFWWGSAEFNSYQLASHIFMHGDLGHLFSNMFMLWMFGSILENVWGGKRFLIYYFVTALGAAVLHNLIKTYDVYQAASMLSSEEYNMVKAEGYDVLKQSKNYMNPLLAALNSAMNTPTVGASGAVFGVLLAFGMLFPNTEIFLYFLFPVKAKYFVIGYGALELWLGIKNNPADNVAHFAHLGGMLFGFLLIKYWNKNNRKNFF
jgi:membrane associated rhomboid family serine protease